MADPRRSAGPPASVRVWSPPGPPSRGVTVTVACPTRTTRLPHLLGSDDPAARSVQVEVLVTLAAFRHADRCGACDLEPVHVRFRPHGGRLMDADFVTLALVGIIAALVALGVAFLL